MVFIFTGFPIDSDPSTWQEFRQYQDTEYIGRFEHYQNVLNKKCRYNETNERDKSLGFYCKSPYLNVYGIPEQLDYLDVVQLPPKIARADDFLRKMSATEAWKVPEGLAEKPGKLIYVSMGSMGSIDVDLMKRIVSVLAKSKNKFIVSKGLRGDEYELPENCWGGNFLPQLAILPVVDLVITHGGNNSAVESLAQGKPMVRNR